MTTLQPPDGFKPVNGQSHEIDIHEAQGPQTSVLTRDQKQSVSRQWDERFNALEKPLKDLVQELKTAKGADLKVVEKKINDFEKQIHDFQQNIRKELTKDLTPQAKKQLEAKWTGQLKQMEQNFVKDLPADKKGSFDKKWNDTLKEIEKEISSAKEQGEPQPVPPPAEQKQTGFAPSQEITEVAALQKAETASLATAVSQIRELIRSSLETLAIDEKGGALMTLSTEATVPVSLQGANLALNVTERGYSIEFSNLSPEKAQAAIDLMRQNPDEMNRFLQSLNVSDLKVGNVIVYQAPAAPTPIQAMGETTRERGDEGRREGGGGGGGEQEGGGGGRQGQQREQRGR